MEFFQSNTIYWLILGIAGIVVSRKATKEIAKTNEDGRGLAISGLICSVVGVIIQILTVSGFVLFSD